MSMLALETELSFEERFNQIALEALKRHPIEMVDAWREIGAHFGYQYLQQLKAAMKEGTGTHLYTVSRHAENNKKPFVARIKQDTEKLRTVIQKARQQIVFGYTLSDGRDLAKVKVAEMDALERDGKLMAELKREIGEITDNMQKASLGELLTQEQVQAARERAGV